MSISNCDRKCNYVDNQKTSATVHINLKIHFLLLYSLEATGFFFPFP